MTTAPAFDPTRQPTTNRPLNDGTSMDDHTSRLDGVPKVDGSARYGRDMYPEGCLFARFIRCPYGSGELRSIDDAAARALPGVIAVNVEAREANYHGRTIGTVVADSPRALDRAMTALAAQWRVRDVRTTIEDSGPDDPPAAAVAATLDGADAVVEAVYTTAVQTHACLETHGAVVAAQANALRAWVSTQGVQGAADGLARALEIPRSDCEVISEYVGGGFGSKLMGAGKEGVVAARLSREHGRPVWLFCDREEEHLDTGNRPSSRTFVRVGASRDGTILGGQIHSWGTPGIGRGGGGVSIPSGFYRLGELDRNHADVQTNAGPPRPFRAPGKPQASFAEEMMLDELAAGLGIDPLDLRRRCDTSDARKKMYDTGAARIGWSQRQANGAGGGTLRTGYGVAATGWGAFPSQSQSEVIINPDGSVESRQGAQDIGQGFRTIMAVCCANVLGIPLDRVKSSVGRSQLPYGPGSGGSVTATNTAPSMEAAAEAALESLLETVAERDGGTAADYSVFEGTVLRANEPHMSWDEACQLLPRPIRGEGTHGGRGRRQRGRPTGTGHSDGVQFAKVTVDVETGVVTVDHVVALQACGRIISRKTSESQVIGGVIQGVSYALFEERVLDRATGSMLNPNMEWYKILGSRDMPHIEPLLWEDGSTGVRPLGEPPVIPTAGAIGCAVFNAIGTPVRSLPLTPPRVLAAIAEGGAA